MNGQSKLTILKLGLRPCSAKALLGVALAFLTVLFPGRAAAQLYVQWQAVLGGTNYDECASLHPTADGGCVVGGGSDSGATGNRTQANYGWVDYWLVKMDAKGNKVWDQACGGDDDDYINALQPATDGGWLLGGQSWSGATGNKTSAGFGGSDFWLVKTDAGGNKVWESEFGGTLTDVAWHLASATNGYLLVGWSSSPVSGNKTSATHGSAGIDDGWVVKVDSNGVKQWEASFGGTGPDDFYAAAQTTDGGFILAGESYSGMTGNKSSTNYGYFDGWVIKLDGNGYKQWDVSLGGTNDEFFEIAMPLGDGGCLVGGSSTSGATGSKTTPTFGGYDWWLVKLNSSGNKQWERAYGGNQNDYLKGIQPTGDGGYLLFGTSWSGVSGNKTSPGFGESDYWLVKVDAMGNKLWDQAFGGANEDYAAKALETTSDGGYILGGLSNSGISGNKTAANIGDFDYWVVKLVAAPIITISPAVAGQANLSWSSSTGTNWVLQESLSLSPAMWSNSPSGSTRPITISTLVPSKYYRLYRP